MMIDYLVVSIRFNLVPVLHAGDSQFHQGLNQRITPISNKTLHRWTLLMDDRCDEFALYTMELEHSVMFMSPFKKYAGADISADSTEPLPPGREITSSISLVG